MRQGWRTQLLSTAPSRLPWVHTPRCLRPGHLKGDQSHFLVMPQAPECGLYRCISLWDKLSVTPRIASPVGLILIWWCSSQTAGLWTHGESPRSQRLFKYCWDVTCLLILVGFGDVTKAMMGNTTGTMVWSEPPQRPFPSSLPRVCHFKKCPSEVRSTQGHGGYRKEDHSREIWVKRWTSRFVPGRHLYLEEWSMVRAFRPQHFLENK